MVRIKRQGEILKGKQECIWNEENDFKFILEQKQIFIYFGWLCGYVYVHVYAHICVHVDIEVMTQPKGSFFKYHLPTSSHKVSSFAWIFS